MRPQFKENSCDKHSQIPNQVRKIKPTKRSVSGQYAFRGQTAIPYESTLERDFLIRSEFQLSVLEVISQPIEVPFVGNNGRSYTYTPDFLVYFRLGSRCHVDYPAPLLVEVKPEEQWRLNWRNWFPKWKAARRYAKAQGWSFRIYDETRIRGSALENIKFLERYGRMNFEDEDCAQILQTVREMGSCTLDYILARYFMGVYQKRGIALIWHLVSTRKLDCDITAPLSHATELWVPDYD